MALIIVGIVIVAFAFWLYEYHKNYNMKYLKHNKEQGKVVL